MKITFEIDDEKLQEEVYGLLVKEVKERVQKQWGEGYRFRNDTKAVMREVIRAGDSHHARRGKADGGNEVPEAGFLAVHAVHEGGIAWDG